MNQPTFLMLCPDVRMKRANSLNVLNVGARETQDGAQVRTALFKRQPKMARQLLNFTQDT